MPAQKIARGKETTVEKDAFDGRTFLEEEINKLEADFYKCSFEGCKFIRCNLSGVRFSTCSFKGAKFVECLLVDADMGNSKYDGAEFKLCILKGADFTSSHISTCVFNTCDITEAIGLSRLTLSACPVIENCVIQPVVVDEVAMNIKNITKSLVAALPAPDSSVVASPGGISKSSEQVSGARQYTVPYWNRNHYTPSTSVVAVSRRAYLYCSDPKFFELEK